MANEGLDAENQGLINKPLGQSSLTPDPETVQPDTSLFGLLWNSFFECLGLLGAIFGQGQGFRNYSYSKVRSPAHMTDLQLELDELDAYHDSDLEDFESASISCIDEGRDRVESEYRVYDAKPFVDSPGTASSQHDMAF